MKRASLLVLFLLLSCFMTTVRAEGIPANSSANYLPKDTIFLASIPNFQKSKEMFLNTGVFQFLVSEQADTLLKAATGRERYYDEAMEIINAIIDMIKVGEPLLKNTGSDLELALYFKKRPFVCVSFAAEEEKKNEAVDIILELVQMSVETKYTVEEKEVEGIHYRELCNEYGYSDLVIFWLNGRVYFGQPAILEQFVAVITGKTTETLAANQTFVSQLQAAAKDDAFVYTSLGKGSMMKRLGLTGLNGSLVTNVTQNGFSENLCLTGEGAEESLKGFAADPKPLSLNGTKFLPGDASCYLGMKLPKDLINLTANLPMPGLDENVLKCLGKEVGVYASCSYINPTFLAVIELADVEAITVLFSTLTAMEILEEKQFGDADLYCVNAKNLQRRLPYVIALMVKDDSLLVGTLQAVKEAYSQEAESSLFANATFKQKIAGHLQDNPNLLFYGDLQGILKAWWPLVTITMPKKYRHLDRVREDLAIPTADELIPFVKDEIISIKINGNSISAKTEGSLPILTTIAPPFAIYAAEKNQPETRGALAIVKNFSSAAVQHVTSSEDSFYWEDGTTDFGTEFAHVEKKYNYTFKYLSNDTNNDGKGTATAYMYIAIPDVVDGTQPFYAIDENTQIYTAEITEEIAVELRKLTGEKIDWTATWQNRITVEGLELTRK